MGQMRISLCVPVVKTELDYSQHRKSQRALKIVERGRKFALLAAPYPR